MQRGAETVKSRLRSVCDLAYKVCCGRPERAKEQFPKGGDAIYRATICFNGGSSHEVNISNKSHKKISFEKVTAFYFWDIIYF